MPARKPRASRGSQRRTNLPVFLTSFVGRELEIEQVRRALEQSRLVTLVSPGGAGKTRLAVRVAQELAGANLSAVRIVDFAGISQPADVPHQAALALGLDGQTRPPLEEVVLRLERRALLLLLDNCEHVREAVVELALQVLTNCPSVRILATSRERLGVPGETLFTVPALSLPGGGAGLTSVAVARSEAVSLFVERARSIRPGFALSDGNMQMLVSICMRLEGIPLAIELAAARLRMLSLEEIWDRLDDRFRLLVGGQSGRQVTLLATIDWSHRLLTEPERHMFRRLSVFPNGFRFEAAVQVAADVAGDVLDLLGRLVDKSLIQIATDPDGRSRYRMLESLREYGLLRLDEHGETDMAEASHLEHYLAMAEIIAAHLDAPDVDRWLDRVESDHDNFRAALAWSRRHSPRRFMRLASALGWFWQRRGDTGEGRRWVESALAVDDHDAKLQLDLLHWASVLAAYEMDWRAAAGYASRVLESEAAAEYPLARARALLALGNVAFYHDMDGGEVGVDRLVSVMRRYLDACRLFTDLGSLTGQVSARLNLCMVELVSRNFEAAKEHAGAAMALAVELGWKHHQQSALGRFGTIALVEGNAELAARFFRQALRIPIQRMPAANALYLSFRGLACVAAAQRRYDDCALLLGAADAVSARDVVRSLLPPELEAVMSGICLTAQEALGNAYEGAHEVGAQLSETDAIERAFKEADVAGPGGDEIDRLSRRELEIARLVADGMTNREVSQLLCISRRTVDSHLDHIRNKLGLRSRTQLVRWLLSNEREEAASV